MQKRIIGFVVIAVAALAPLCGCGQSEPVLPQGELDAMRDEVRSLLDRADFYCERSYFAGAKREYEQAVKKAKNYLYYDPQSSDVDAMLKKAEERLRSVEIAEGTQGKIRIGGEWVNPASYCASRIEKLKKEADAAFVQKWPEIEKSLKESPPLSDAIMENGAVQEILAAGGDAIPFVMGWLEGDDRELRDIAFALLDVMEDRDDVIFTWALAHVGSGSPSLRNQSVALLRRFPREETTAALLPFLGSSDESLLNAVVMTLCEARTELGKQVLLETARESSRTSLIRLVILRHIYLLRDKDAVDLLAEVVRETAADQTQSYIRSVSISSLLKMDIPEALPAFAETLQRIEKSEKDVAVRMLARIKEASYAEAAPAVVKTFIMFSKDRDVTELAVDIMEKTAGPDNVKDLISMVLTMDVGMDGVAQNVDTDSIFVRITDIIRRVKSDNTVVGFADMLASYQPPETVARAVHALGVLGEESAVPKMWDVYRTFDSDLVKIAVINALSRIGSRQSMEQMAMILKSNPPPDVLKYATEQAPRLMVGDSAFRELFAKLDGVPDEALAGLFATIGREKKPAALRPLIERTFRGEAAVRWGAFRALTSFKGMFSEEDIAELNKSILNCIAELEKEPDAAKVRDAFIVLKLHVDDAMPTFIYALKAEYWPIGYYSAEALASASLESARKYREEIRAVYGELVNKRKDYHTGLLLAGCLGASDDEISAVSRAGTERENKTIESRAAGVIPGDTLESLTEKFGGDYEKTGPEESRSLYIYYRPLGLVFALGEALRSEDRPVWGIGYVAGFKGAAYGAEIGGTVDNVLMIAGPPPDDPALGLHYLKEIDAYAVHDVERKRWIMYFLGLGRVVGHVVETGENLDEKQRAELKNVLDAVRLGD